MSCQSTAVCLFSISSFLLLFFSLFLAFTQCSYVIISKFTRLKKPPGSLPMEPINTEEGSKLPSQLLELFSEVGLAFHV